MLDRHQQSESPTLAYMSDLEHGTKLEVKNNPVIVGTGHFGGPRPRWPLETVSLVYGPPAGQGCTAYSGLLPKDVMLEAGAIVLLLPAAPLLLLGHGMHVLA